MILKLFKNMVEITCINKIGNQLGHVDLCYKTSDPVHYNE